VTAFVDTSALYAVLDSSDVGHEAAGRHWTEVVRIGERLITTNYVLVETQAILQRRLGMEAVRVFASDVVPLLQVHWVDQNLHQAGLVAVLTAGRRDLSLVDCISFEAMRRLGIQQAFAFDPDFAEQGFECVPG
jgi:predicted nucleic acid-binding protein